LPRPDIILPSKTGEETPVNLSGENNIVIVGANGSGKSKFGYWLEFNQPNDLMVHRLSAQKVLDIPDAAQPLALSYAQNGLFFGNPTSEASIINKPGYRYQSRNTAHMLFDYPMLLALLFAKDTQRDQEYRKAAREQGDKIPVPDSPIDIIIKVWKDIMPQTQILFDDFSVIVSRNGGPNYPGGQMSDGEKVALYLLGQALCATENSILIVDEPEIHLHKSLMSRLWDKIEELCPNIVLIYITHDLDFAASRKGAMKIWIKNFPSFNHWEWEEVAEMEGFPESLLFEILGSRKNILFCEGVNGSLDSVLYKAAFPDYHIVPLGGLRRPLKTTQLFIT